MSYIDILCNFNLFVKHFFTKSLVLHIIYKIIDSPERRYMHKYTVCVIGDDDCQTYLAEYLSEQGMIVHTHNDFTPSYLEGCDLLIGPADFYTDGILRPDINDACATYHVPVVNYMSNREFLIANAEFTAEGLLSYVIMNTPFTLSGATGLVLGFGILKSS